MYFSTKYSYRFFALQVLVMFHAINIMAQPYSIKGKVIDENSQEILPGAFVRLLEKANNTFILGAVTDTSGVFELNSVPKDAYSIEISFIGFLTDTIGIPFLSNNVDLGTIKLSPSELLLDEVSITSDKVLMTTHLDKKIFNVQEDIMAETSSAAEILQNIPSVNIDINGGITLRNTGNITFFINGKPSALLRRNASAVLEQIPARSIERIEIITNPSAKYRPDGVGGIINIITKNELTNGLKAQVSAHIGNEQRYNAYFNLNYGTEKVKLYGNYGIRHSNATILYNDERVYRDSLGENIKGYYDEDGNSKTNALSHTVLAGANYTMNDYNSMELSASYFRQNSYHNGNSNISTLDSVTNPETNFTNKQTNDELEEEGELNFTYEHSFKNNEDHTITLESTIAAYHEKEDKVFNQSYSFPSDLVTVSKYIIEKSGNQQEILLDYSLPIGEDTEFESGYAGEFIYDNIRYDNNGDNSQFLFNQQIHALYVLFGQSFDQFSYKTGLRAEQALIDSHLKFPIDSLVDNNYFKLFPTLHLGYEISDAKQLSLSYSKRINRPDPDELNPYPEFSDPRNAEAGNPNLKPEQVHSLEFGFQHSGKKHSINATIYYRYKYDAFTAIFNNIGDSIVLYTTTNLDTRQSGGIEAILSGNIFNNLTYSLTSDVFYTTINAVNLGYTNSKSSISGNLKGYALIKLTKTTSLQLNAYQYFPSITPQGKREPFFYFNLGLKQNIFNNTASLTLTGTDIFHTYKIKYDIESAELQQYTLMQRKQPVVYLGFTWRINNYKGKDKLGFEGEGIRK